MTDDGRFLLVYQQRGHGPAQPDLPAGPEALRRARSHPFLDAFDASYGVVGNDGDIFYVLTDKDAPRYRLVAINRRPARRRRPGRQIVPQDPGKDVLSSVGMIGDRFVVVWQIDAHDRAEGLRQGRHGSSAR